MSASPRAECVFRYARDVEGVYRGSSQVVEPDGTRSTRPALQVVLSRPEWVKFVVETIKLLPEATAVVFDLTKPDSTTYRHVFDPRTVDKIKREELSLDDLIL